MKAWSYMNEISANPALFERDLLPRPRAFEAPAHDDAALLMVAGSGLFDLDWYAAENLDLAGRSLDPLRHFLNQGWQEARRPNPYFDVEHYLAENPDVAAAGINPLLHYILAGEEAGLPPSPHFDLAWYASRQGVAEGRSPLAHFLAHRLDGQASPCPEFDTAFYLATNPDIAAARVDPFLHYLRRGYLEGRDPSASFNTRFYLQRYLDGATDENPLVHYRRWRHALRLHTQPGPHERGVFEQARGNARPGPDFEDIRPLPRAATPRAKLLAYFLPQFHKVAENDAWWGEGFTEWTAIARGMPRFDGHYQPRIPGALGHYDLSDPETMRRQIALARGAGVFGFVHYFYWFNGRRLLDAPIEAMLADRSLDFPFCLMWANENWTRRWDGSDQEILMSQDYRAEDDVALLACFARHFADPRYIRIAGRPVLMIYRASLIPDCADTIERWRAMFRGQHGEDPILVMAQSFHDLDPRAFGFDGAIEFPPHKLTQRLATCNQQIRYFDTAARGQVFAYDDVAAASLAEPAPSFPLIKTALPGWDNDARREGMGMALHGATPVKYQAWLEALVDRSADQPFHGERLVCVNAWNEWAEGAYLEPDMHYGAAFLNATGRAVCGLLPEAAGERVLLVGHDAYPAGAQMLLLHLGRQLMAAHGVAIEFLLLGEGAMLAQYAALAPTTVARDRPERAAAIAAAWRRGVRQALVNSSVAALAIPQLARAGIEGVLLVHEMPRLLARAVPLQGLRAGALRARRVIFPAACVQNGFAELVALPPERLRILPQGVYRREGFDAEARSRIREQLGIAEGEAMVLGCGTGNLRKGFDLFLQIAQLARRRMAPLHFCWVGELDETLAAELAIELEAAVASGHAHFPGFQADVPAWMSAADAFALTSREDPYPSVALEALVSGIAVAAFAGGGGIAELLQAGTGVVPMADTDAMLGALTAMAAPCHADARAGRALAAAARFDFAGYTAEILAELRPHAPRISVAVPSHDYARFLPERLSSIFAQTLPVEEVILLDDASTDDSVAVARTAARDWRRDLRIVGRDVNGGSVFLQWQAAASLARGTHLWIAEADDAADPTLLTRLARMLAEHPGIDIAFCDSRAVDSEGALLMPSYKDYYRSHAPGLLQQDGVFDGRDFLRRGLAERNTILNASAVVFRTEALRQALTRCTPELATWRVAGDWRIYVDILTHGNGRVGYLAAPLNAHRRHRASATGRLDDAGMQHEIARMHAHVNQVLGADPARAARQQAYCASFTPQIRAA